MNKIITLLLFSCCCFSLYPETKTGQNFQVMVVDEINSINPNNLRMLDTLKNEWGLTGVDLTVKWYEPETLSAYSEGIENEQDVFTWNQLDAAISQILNKSLTVDFQFYTGGRFMPPWVESTLSSNDFMQTRGRIPYLYSNTGRKMLNFNSPNSKRIVLERYSKFLDHLKLAFPSQLDKFGQITPAVACEGEFEYPHDQMCGYSIYDVEYFQNYLKELYSNRIESLNSSWGTDFNNFTDIDQNNYNWNLTNAELGTDERDYPNGRNDWMKARTKSLKELFDDFAMITKQKGFKIALQVGSIYDERIERRGWIDPTSLAENADDLRTDDIAAYMPNFQFSADYSKSICNYWNSTENKKLTFSTAIGFPWHASQQSNALIQQSIDYTKQSKFFYEKGATSVKLVYYNNTAFLSYFRYYYQDLRRYLKSISNKPIITPSSSTKAIHLSCEVINNEASLALIRPGTVYDYEWQKLFLSVTNKHPDVPNPNQYATNTNNYDGNCDIVTNYMLKNNINYLKQYSVFNLTASSKFIPDLVYKNLLDKSNSSLAMDNATWFSNNGHGEFAVTAGIKDENNNERCPINLIWRTRTDIMRLFPKGNFADYVEANKIGWNIKNDYIFWAKTYGESEYPGLKIVDSNGKYVYDATIRAVWNYRSDLQRVFPNAHYNTTSNYPELKNLLQWVTTYGWKPNECAALISYQYWPYMGDANSIPVKSQLDNSNVFSNSTLYQNYPNPFNPVTEINYHITEDANVKLSIFNALGNQVALLVNNTLVAGNHTVTFDGSKLSSGLYYYTLEVAGKNIDTKKMILCK